MFEEKKQDKIPLPPKNLEEKEISSLPSEKSNKVFDFKKEPSIIKKLITIIIGLLIIGGLGYGAYWGYGKIQSSKTKQQKTLPQEVEKNINNEKETGVKAPVLPNDTDGDGLSDQEEIKLGTDPNKVDTDGDGLSDYEEVKIYQTNPLNPDTDNDGYLDGQEVKNGYNPKGSGKLENSTSTNIADEEQKKITIKGAEDNISESDFSVNKLFTIPKGYGEKGSYDIFFSPDGKRFAYLVKDSTGMFMVIDSIIGKSYEKIENIIFSPDSKQFAYIAKNGSDYFVIFNGEESSNYKEVENLTFSPDGKQFAYVAIKKGMEFIRNNQKQITSGGYLIVLNNKEGKTYFYIHSPIFSPDSKQFAYMAEEHREFPEVKAGGNAQFIVLNNKEMGDYYDWISNPTFSPDSKHFAYEGFGKMPESILGSFDTNFKRKRILIIDNKEINSYDGGNYITNDITLSPDGKQFAYILEDLKNKKRSVILNNQRGKDYNFIDSLTFSPDSKQFAYAGLKGSIMDGPWTIVINNQEKGDYDTVRNFIFSPDSKQFAYIATKGFRDFIVLNGKEGKRYHLIDSLSFSPDSKQLAYLAVINIDWFAVFQNQQGEVQETHISHFSPLPSTLRFNNDGKFITYRSNFGYDIFEIKVVNKLSTTN